MSYLYDYFYPTLLPTLISIEDSYLLENSGKYTMVYDFDSIEITINHINEVKDIFKKLQEHIKYIFNYKITEYNKKNINNMDMDKSIDMNELFRLVGIYCNWVKNNSNNTKVLRLPSLKDAFNGCLFLFYAFSDTSIINDKNFNNIEYANSLMNVVTYINIIKRYQEEDMLPEIKEIINTFSN
jgi:hypothetical protein